jgi:hypothetical protein
MNVKTDFLHDYGLKRSITVLLVISAIFIIQKGMADTQQIFVDADAPGIQDGSSWTNAFHYLQDALSIAQSGNVIRVAQGIYTPDRGLGITPGNRSAAFHLINGVILEGGYAGYGEVNPDARDISVYETILSGDLSSNDVAAADPADLLTELSRVENSYQVVICDETVETTILDGLTIADGNANNESGTYPNWQNSGGGMYNYKGSGTIRSCTLCNNTAVSGGGGMFSTQGGVMLNTCRFIHNATERVGGGVCLEDNFSPGMNLDLCVFSGNYAGRDGGGMTARSSRPTFISCVFNGNHAVLEGGGMQSWYSNPSKFINCTFALNTSDETGGGLYGESDSVELDNCILWNNSDSNGMNESAQIYIDDVDIDINFSCVQEWSGVMGGTNNFSDDPLFVDATGADGVPATGDDDLHLRPGSSCLNIGNNNIIQPGTFDLDGNKRISGCAVDLGVYEYVITGAWITARPSSYNFGNVILGESENADITVINSGVTELNGYVSNCIPPFSVVSGSPYQAAVCSSATVIAGFAPQTVGIFSNEVLLTGGDHDSVILLTGMGIPEPTGSILAGAVICLRLLRNRRYHIG